MASIRPHSSGASGNESDSPSLSLSPTAAGTVYLQALPSQAWQLQQALTVSSTAPFTATLAATDTTATWLSQFVNTSTVTLTGSGPDSTNLTIQSIECDVVHPAPAKGSELLKLSLSTSKNVLQHQFGTWTSQDAGLELFGHEGAILLGVKDVATQEIPVKSLVELAGIHISPWAGRLLNLLLVKPVNTEGSRNGLWIFAQQRQAILRLEFELDPKDIPQELMNYLPDHSEVALSVTVKKTAQFGFFRPDPEVNGEVFLAGSVAFAASAFKQAKLDVYVFLGMNGTTYTIQNEGEVGFLDMLKVFAEHIEEKLKESSVHTVFKELTDRLDTHLGASSVGAHPETTETEKAPEATETTTKTPEYSVFWHDISLTISNERLASISMTLEIDTPFGVSSGRSAFLFTFQWSLISKEISLNGRFWPSARDGQPPEPKMTLPRMLHPTEEKHAIYIQHLPMAQPKLSLVHLYPGFSVGQIPSWVPQDLVVLSVTLSTSEIELNAVVQSATSTDTPEWSVPEKTQLDISFRYLIHQKDSMTFSIDARVNLPPPSSAVVASSEEPASLSMKLSYESPRWTIEASANQLTSAHLYSLFPDKVRDDIVRMMPAVRLPALIVNYACGGTADRVLMVSGFLIVGGLLLRFTFQHSSSGAWQFFASAEASASKAANQISTIQSIVEQLLGLDAKTFLPDFVNNVKVPLAELNDDAISITISKSGSVGAVFGFEVRLDSLHLDFAQLPSLVSPGSAPKRLLRLSINEFPAVPKIPLIGDVPQPFDQIGFLWTTEEFTMAEIAILNTILYQGENKILYRESKSAKNTDAVLGKGLHFMLAMNKDGQPTVVIDYVFGKPKNKQVDTTKENTKQIEGAKQDEKAEEKPVAKAEEKTDPKNDEETDETSNAASEMTPISKKTKTLSISNVGLQMTDHILTVHLNATVRLGPIEMAMTGFALHFDLSEAQLPHLAGIKPSFSLDGLAIAYNRKPIDIAGMFLHQKTSSDTMTADTYAGGVVIGMSSYSFAAVGAYSQVTPRKPANSTPFSSFFIFGALAGPLMNFDGVELRGISGGFGYNSFVNMPTEDITNFPFLTILKDSSQSTSDPMKMLASFTDGQTIVPQQDALWLAAGLKLRAFELVDVTAVVALQLSQGDPVLTILAEASATIPQSASSVDHAFGFLDFGIIATLNLAEGTLIIRGQLSTQSFLLSKACHPTGGFALAIWPPSSSHGGDMCFSVGGFHPAFSQPSHYPTAPPRLGISWAYDAHVSISGGAYYAITPAAIMAGASIQVLFALDRIQAHFEAHADFLIEFEPLHYQASVGVLASVSGRIGWGFLSKTLSLSLSADLDLHGPPMAGTASFGCHVVTFHVAFGNSNPQAIPLTLQKFWDMLSAGTATESQNHVMAIEGGLVPSNNKDSSKVSVVRGSGLVLGIYSRTPISTVVYRDKPLNTGTGTIYSRPMQLNHTSLTSEVEFTISPQPERDFTLSLVRKRVPSSIWGRYDGTSTLNAPQQTIEHAMGVQLVAPPPVEAEDKLPLLDENFFGHSSELTGELACNAPVTTTPATTGTTTTTGNAAAAPATKSQANITNDPFSSVRQAWKKPSINPLSALQAFITAVADQPAFGTVHAPNMSPNASWAALETCVATPTKCIDRMEEYYLRAPRILQCS